MGFRSLVIASAVVALAGCSGSGDSLTSDEADAASVVETETSAPTTSTTTAEAPTTTTTPVVIEDTPASEAEPVPPARRSDELLPPSEPDGTAAWISRRSMSADAIDLVWSSPVSAATYEIHRVVAEGGQPADSAMTSETRIHSVVSAEPNGTYLDEEVSEGELYWYGVRGLDEDGAVLSTGWHEAAAVTDEEPPLPVAVTADVEAGDVLVSWDQPEDNFRVHSYRVLRAVGDGEPEHISTTWNIDQTSFLDDEALVGSVTYSIVSLDFHWNESEPSSVTIDLS